MSGIKIYPPNQLPAEGISDAQFRVWKEELEVYLETEEKFDKFLPGGRYAEWEAAEVNENRIETPKDPDTEQHLIKIRKDLRQFITLIAKYVNIDYYNPIIRHSTSLAWIYTKIREDFDIQQQGIHFFNILDLTWDPTGQTTPVGFYNSFRSIILGNLAKKNNVIAWKSETLQKDEQMTPSHEDFILLHVLMLLHPKLPAYIREKYAHKMGQEKRLMDFKTEILTKARQFISEIENPQLSNIQPQLAAMNTSYTPTNNPTYNPAHQRRPQSYNQRFPQPPQSYPRRQPANRTRFQKPNPQNIPSASPFCRLCHLAGTPRSIFTSHFLGDYSCHSMSSKDRQMMAARTSTPQLSALDAEPEEEDIAAEYGYDDIQEDTDQSQVHINMGNKIKCNFIQPVPAQTFSLKDNNDVNVHIDLDSGATVSFAKLSAVQSHGFQIKPNSQLSSLADGKTKMSAVGEIHETFYRNNWSVPFHAIVTENLHTDFVGGNNFLKENNITQNINEKNVIIQGKYTVPETNKNLILQTCPNNLILQNNHVNVLFPGQSIMQPVPHPNNSILAIEPCQENKDTTWPPPQLCRVTNGQINIINDTGQAINVKKQVPRLRLRTTTEMGNTETEYQHKISGSTSQTQSKSNDTLNTGLININNNNIPPEAIQSIHTTNNTYKDVFNEDLKGGYNMAYGKHLCRMNWATSSRPPTSKVHTVNYDHETKKLLQEVCDLFTEHQVLGIPQEHDIQVKHVSPCFLVRKQRAKTKPKHLLTPSDVRLVVNFGQINEYLLNLPTPVTKPKDIFNQLGKWKHIITMDLFQGFYQNHMTLEDAPWLGISTPFGGLRFLRRSGQGLIGQSEEMDELLTKVIGPEIQSGAALRIADDLYIGGETPGQTAKNYNTILSKLSKANLKISPSKTNIFLPSVDILGWVWKQGGFLEPSPHRKIALKNTKPEDIKVVKDMRSWLGLYKTLIPASPNLTILLDPFDQTTADRDSKEPYIWDRDLNNAFSKAVTALDSLVNLYLPHPDDQLLLVVDAAKTNPGLGHTLYAIKDNKKLPVAFHSTKLKPPYAQWNPCELEALAFATAITAEYNFIKESKKPIIISPDSKSVADAVKLIKKGHFSTNPRIQTLITNVNRVPMVIQLASGKANLNTCGDYQSRHPSECQAEQCSVCNFVDEKGNATLDPFAINAITPEKPAFQNKAAWQTIQQEDKACQQAMYHITSGKTPSKRSGKVASEIRRLCTIGKVNNKGLLVVLNRPNKFSSVTDEQTIIPSSYLPALLWQLHNLHNHPAKTQLRSLFDKNFYSVGLTAAIETLYDECHFCLTQKKIPDLVQHNTKTEAQVPGTNFHADVIRRQSQYILTITDHFSSYSTAKIIKAENHCELKKGIIELITPIKLNQQVEVRVDNATGFKPLLDNKDPDLNKLNILLTPTDPFNKNGNAVVDKTCQELEAELRKLEPDGRPISNTTLIHATTILNQKLRRNGQVSAFEMQFNRDMNTGTNLNLDYDKLRKEQISNRTKHNDRHNEEIQVKKDKTFNPQPHKGDLVSIPIKNDKHVAKDLYIVSDAIEDKVHLKKIIHSHDKQNINFRSKTYITDQDRVYVVKKNNQPNYLPNTYDQKEMEQPILKKKSNWNPIQQQFYQDQDEDKSANMRTYTENIPAENNIPEPVLPEPILPEPILPENIRNEDIPPNQPQQLQQNEFYQELNNWLGNQQQQAAQQLHNHQNAVQEYVNPPIRPVDTAAQPKISEREKQKQVTRQKIRACLQPNIQQTDGAMITPESSLPTSPDSSEQEPEPSKTSIEPEKSKTSTELEKDKTNQDDKLQTRIKRSHSVPALIQFKDYYSTQSSEFLFNDQYAEDDYTGEFSPFSPMYASTPHLNTPYLDKAFNFPCLNLSASNHPQLVGATVYKFNNLLDNLPPDTFFSPVKKKNSRYKKIYTKIAKKCKKLHF